MSYNDEYYKLKANVRQTMLQSNRLLAAIQQEELEHDVQMTALRKDADLLHDKLVAANLLLPRLFRAEEV